jgi:homoserine kinase
VSVVAGSAQAVRIAYGTPVSVQVPATSANLGPGFDSLGLAFELYDRVTVEAFDPAAHPSRLEVSVDGHGAQTVPMDESHLVVHSLRSGLAHAGAPQPALRLYCRNAIPHGRGLGSSSAAIVAGLLAARGLLADPAPLDDEAVFALATAAEGHPDNVAAGAPGRPGSARAVCLPVDSEVRAVVCVPDGELATSRARAMLPTHVPHADAAFNAGRSALLVQALTRQPELLVAATEDRLHQEQRASAMPATAMLVGAVRAAGGAAVVSGAGPSVLVLGAGDQAASAVGAAFAACGEALGAWRVLTPAIDTHGALLITDSTRSA